MSGNVNKLDRSHKNAQLIELGIFVLLNLLGVFMLNRRIYTLGNEFYSSNGLIIGNQRITKKTGQKNVQSIQSVEVIYPIKKGILINGLLLMA